MKNTFKTGIIITLLNIMFIYSYLAFFQYHKNIEIQNKMIDKSRMFVKPTETFTITTYGLDLEENPISSQLLSNYNILLKDTSNIFDADFIFSKDDVKTKTFEKVKNSFSVVAYLNSRDELIYFNNSKIHGPNYDKFISRLVGIKDLMRCEFQSNYHIQYMNEKKYNFNDTNIKNNFFENSFNLDPEVSEPLFIVEFGFLLFLGVFVLIVYILFDELLENKKIEVGLYIFLFLVLGGFNYLFCPF
jgi:hypothetical protein